MSTGKITARGIMKIMNRLPLIPVLIALLALSTPISTSAATECSVGNMSGIKVNGQCVYFTKGDDPYSKYGCSANNPSGYGVSQFPCPEELLKAYEKNAASEQEKINTEQKENEQRSEEELDKKIREAVEEYAKEQEKIGDNQTPSTQVPATAQTTAVPQQTKSVSPIESATAAPSVPIPETSALEGGLENSGILTSTSVPAVSNFQDETKPVPLWVRVSSFLSRLNPFSWFK